MSTAAVRAPVATARPPRGRSFRSVFHAWHARRRPKRGVYVAISHAADVPPT